MSTSIDALRQKASRIHAAYDAHFAGQPRISRDPALLDDLVRQIEAVSGEADDLPRAERDTLRDELRQTRDLYQREAQAVRDAQAGGPDAFEAHHLSTWAQVAFGRYRRHFAGKARATRDLGLLGELIEDLERLDAQMQGLAKRFDNEELRGARTSLEANLKLYRQERAAIREARLSGTLDEQAGILATLANDQFELYRTHFAGQPRNSRRPSLLERIVTNLETILDRMKGLQQQGLHAEANDNNIGIVEGRLAAYRTELEAVRQARQQTSWPDLVNALGQAANALFDKYRENYAGHDRATRDPDLLASIAEGLVDVARQMDDLDRVREDDTNQHNLQIVLDHLRLYDREHGLIRQAREGQQ